MSQKSDATRASLIQPLRKDRAVKDEGWIKAFLHQASYGILATEWQGQPFAKPTLFAFDEAAHAIYFHGATEGRMRTNLEANPHACFCVSEMGRLLPSSTAMGFGVEYASVMAFGMVQIVEEAEEARYGLQLLLDKYFPHLRPGEDYRPILPEELQITTVYCLQIDAWSGKKKQVQGEVPDAFLYPHVTDGQGKNPSGDIKP